MTSLVRRLDRLGARFPLGPCAVMDDQVSYVDWLATLPDDDLELMAGEAEHLRDGGDSADLDAAMCKEMARIVGTWETYRKERQ